LFDLLQELMDSINARYNSRFKPWNWTEGMKQSCQELSAAISCFEHYACLIYYKNLWIQLMLGIIQDLNRGIGQKG